ncbi:TniB family NTP-binding protein [Methylocystis sp. JAN1]|uniref:TniB family NTP-binding protein n=1 Tax=Methylocystis sp. JAN1 TaxID=3397211 RepID=UPI003FA21213
MTIDPKSLRNADGLYPDDIAHILENANPEKKKMLTTIGKLVVSNTRYDEGQKWLEDVFQEYGTRHEATAGLFYGISGVGKSTILKRFAKKLGGPFPTVSGRISRPVARVVTPSNTDLGAIYDEILIALDAPDLIIGKLNDKKHAVMTQLCLQDVKLVLFDEFTHVVEDRSEKFTKKLMRAVKGIVSENVCQVVLAGTEDLPAVHQQYSQMRRRSGGDLTLTPFDWEEDRDRKEWREILEQVEYAMPIKPATSLPAKATAERLHKASNGVLDHLMKLLFRATAVAYDEGNSAIAGQDLWQAFERMRRGKNKTPNPWPQPEGRTSKPRLLAPMDDEPSNLRSTGRNARNEDDL